METLSYLFYITNLPHVRKENKKKKKQNKTKNKKQKNKNKKSYIPILFLGEESKEYWIMSKHVLFVILQSSVDMTDQPIHYYC